MLSRRDHFVNAKSPSLYRQEYPRSGQPSPAWKEVQAQTKGIGDAVRSAKPLLQNIVDDHARSRKK
jgi:hypothetical protein